MNKNEKIKLKKEAKKMFYDMMDTRDKVYIAMAMFESKYGFIPDQYKGDMLLMNAYKEYKRCGGWQKVPGAKLVMNKAIQKYVKDKIANPDTVKVMTEKEKKAYLQKETKKIYASVNRAKGELNKLHGEKIY